MQMSDLADRAQVLGGRDHGKQDRRRWEQTATMLHHGFPIPVGEEAIVADLDESTGQHMQQETANEFHSVQGHFLDLVTISGIAPAKADATLFQAE